MNIQVEYIDIEYAPVRHKIVPCNLQSMSIFTAATVSEGAESLPQKAIAIVTKRVHRFTVSDSPVQFYCKFTVTLYSSKIGK